MRAVDLGAAPGGWTEVLARLVGPKGEIYALDILPMDPIEGVHIIQGDFTQDEVFEQLLTQLNQHPIDLVISDMAPNISGIRGIDQPRAMYLAELALDFASKVLKPQGCFLVKVFQGEGFDDYLKTLRQSFQQVKIRKPKSSRSRSNEVYLLAKGFKA
jgi:23S rRNA (uridine2552-2'-O)-methyltransferase